MFEQNPFRSSRSWLLGDHLGSTSMVTDASGVMVSEVRYSAFGETRYQSGTLSTDYLYTGQRQEAEIGLYYYVARWYDPAIGRFVQADSVVPNPGSALGFDRYAYSWNNTLNFVDPSGHKPLCLDNQCFDTEDKNPTLTYTPTKQELEIWMDEELEIGEYFDVEKEIKRNVADIFPTAIGYQMSFPFCTTTITIVGSACGQVSFEFGYVAPSHQPYVAITAGGGGVVGTPILGSYGFSAGPVFHHNVNSAKDIGGENIYYTADVGLSAIAEINLNAEIAYSVDENRNFQVNPETGNTIWSWGYSPEIGVSMEPNTTAHIGAGFSATTVFYPGMGN